MDRAKNGGCPRDHKSRAVGKSENPPALHPISDGPEVCNKLKLVKSFGIKNRYSRDRKEEEIQ